MYNRMGILGKRDREREDEAKMQKSLGGRVTSQVSRLRWTDGWTDSSLKQDSHTQRVLSEGEITSLTKRRKMEK